MFAIPLEKPATKAAELDINEGLRHSRLLCDICLLPATALCNNLIQSRKGKVNSNIFDVT
jgi:hypothetical protein